MRNEQDIPILYHKIRDSFLLKKKIGKGGFGVIYSAENIQTKEPLAVKFEKIKSNSGNSNLLKEAKILHLIFKKALVGFPRIVYFNKDAKYRLLVMSLLGPNIQKLLDKYGGTLSFPSALKVGVQLLERLRDFHELGYIHRDLKPENICVGYDTNSAAVYLIDFGLSKMFLDSKGNHIQIKEKTGLVGTIRYTSVNSHLSIEQSRRDDLESFFYILIYMIKGKLPWQGLVVFDDETRMRKIAELKCSITAEKLTEGLSTKLTAFFKYVKKLKFNEAPDYNYLIKLLHDTAEEKEFKLDEHCFEWVSVRSFSIKSGSKSVNVVNSNIDLMARKFDETSPQGHNQIGSNTKFNTIQFLEIPNTGNTPKASDSELNHGKGGFNSKVVKVDSVSNINSKEEFGIINELASNTHNLSPVSMKHQKCQSGREIKMVLAPRRLSAQGANFEDELSENYSHDVMDENVSSIATKIAKTTLTSSKLIGDINRNLKQKLRKNGFV